RGPAPGAGRARRPGRPVSTGGRPTSLSSQGCSQRLLPPDHGPGGVHGAARKKRCGSFKAPKLVKIRTRQGSGLVATGSQEPERFVVVSRTKGIELLALMAKPTLPELVTHQWLSRNGPLNPT